ncbi:cell wall-active antibiotic response 4TMS protein YvqF [Mucilaginibacter gracilis]|uniref:Cell wall-active antibiotic response 4TMS protein YvqF n=1 Tax=Mucilaginibacter gracilis TaxID=423350 RepID=A0A495JAV9_9SPHI|nr:LiaF domain-containing protein [Mucilaginibacter gracilis]RKR85544.1 cell wall-active antibiotic response 4TMS protein YvqF [Mucilaginibacter gracilis]
MQNDIKQQPQSRNNGKVIAGFILLVLGGMLLLQQLGNYILPHWVFSWGSLFLALGLYSGAKHNFRNPLSYILIVLGTIILLDDIIPGANLQNLIGPVIIIGIGILMILKRNEKWVYKRAGKLNKDKWADSQSWNAQFDWDKKVNPDEPVKEQPFTDYSDINYSKIKNDYTEDYLDATSIFGSANKTILSKNFKGGEIINIFGGAEVDFTQADINGRVVIDVTQIFGGIKLLVPPHWHVTSDMVSLFAGFDDKRKQKTNVASDKVLMITGTSIFAGVEIRSY